MEQKQKNRFTQMTTDSLSNHFKKNVYMKPDEYLNGWAKKCGWKASLVYDSLWRHADNSTRVSFPSIELMAEEHGVSLNTIKRGLKALLDFNLITKGKSRNKKGKFLNNTYVLNDKTKWKEPSMVPTELRTSMVPTGPIHGPHRTTKDTQYKDTHIIHKNVLHKSEGFGNQDITHLINYLKEKLTLPLLDGSVKDNRRFAFLSLRKFQTLDKVKLLIDAAADSPYWSTRVSSMKTLYYNGVQIVNDTRKGGVNGSKITVIRPDANWKNS